MTLRKSQTWGCSKPRFRSLDARAVLRHPLPRLLNPSPWPHDPAKGWPHGVANWQPAVAILPFLDLDLQPTSRQLVAASTLDPLAQPRPPRDEDLVREVHDRTDRENGVTTAFTQQAESQSKTPRPLSGKLPERYGGAGMEMAYREPL